MASLGSHLATFATSVARSSGQTAELGDCSIERKWRFNGCRRRRKQLFWPARASTSSTATAARSSRCRNGQSGRRMPNPLASHKSRRCRCWRRCRRRRRRHLLLLCCSSGPSQVENLNSGAGQAAAAPASRLLHHDHNSDETAIVRSLASSRPAELVGVEIKLRLSPLSCAGQ